LDWVLPGLILLPLLCWDLYLTRRSQRRDREAQQALEHARQREDETSES
jgi:hypothetical protein